jgi:hypothetical protein
MRPTRRTAVVALVVALAVAGGLTASVAHAADDLATPDLSVRALVNDEYQAAADEGQDATAEDPQKAASDEPGTAERVVSNVKKCSTTWKYRVSSRGNDDHIYYYNACVQRVNSTTVRLSTTVLRYRGVEKDRHPDAPAFYRIGQQLKGYGDGHPQGRVINNAGECHIEPKPSIWDNDDFLHAHWRDFAYVCQKDVPSRGRKYWYATGRHCFDVILSDKRDICLTVAKSPTIQV